MIDLATEDDLRKRWRIRRPSRSLKAAGIADTDQERARRRSSNIAICTEPKQGLLTIRQHLERLVALLASDREDLIERLATIPRYIACSRITKRPIFDFVVRAKSDRMTALIVFPFADDYSFGILQSSYHWAWFTERCSTLTERYRYTSNTVFDSFPWPQWGAVTADEEEASARSSRSPVAAALAVAEAARELRRVRAEIREAHPMSLRELYRTLELPGANRLRDAQAALDQGRRRGVRVGPSAGAPRPRTARRSSSR